MCGEENNRAEPCEGSITSSDTCLCALGLPWRQTQSTQCNTHAITQSLAAASLLVAAFVFPQSCFMCFQKFISALVSPSMLWSEYQAMKCDVLRVVKPSPSCLGRYSPINLFVSQRKNGFPPYVNCASQMSALALRHC